MQAESQPRLVAEVQPRADHIVLRSGNEEFALRTEHAAQASVLGLLNALDGRNTVEQLGVSTGSPLALRKLLVQLEKNGLVIDAVRSTPRTGRMALLELEDLANELMYQTVYQNVFWHKVTRELESVPHNVLYGFAIENYHFLFREAYFDSPALCFQSSTRARIRMNEFYGEELGHDELILRGLNHLGISRDDLARTAPLPETMALCNALAYWATFDPLFFFTTLGLLEGKDVRTDSFIEACQRANLDEAFVKPFRDHSNINVNGEHGNLTRELFDAIPVVDDDTYQRMRRQTYLFVDCFDRFHTAVWEHYSTADTLLRRVAL